MGPDIGNSRLTVGSVERISVMQHWLSTRSGCYPVAASGQQESLWRDLRQLLIRYSRSWSLCNLKPVVHATDTQSQQSILHHDHALQHGTAV